MLLDGSGQPQLWPISDACRTYRTVTETTFDVPCALDALTAIDWIASTGVVTVALLLVNVKGMEMMN